MLELQVGEKPTNPYSETWYEDLKAFVRLHKPEDAEAIFNNEYQEPAKSILGKRPLDNDDKTVTDDTIFEQQASAVQRTETTNETKLLLDKKFNQFDQIIQ